MSDVYPHLDKLKVWDGERYSFVPRAEAIKLERAGTHQIVTGLCGHQIKPASAFKPAEKPKRKRGRPKKSTCQTKVQEAQT